MSPSTDIEEEWPWEELETDTEAASAADVTASASSGISTTGESQPVPVPVTVAGVEQEEVVIAEVEAVPVSVPVSVSVSPSSGDRSDSSIAIDSSSSSSSGISSSSSSSSSGISSSSSSSVEGGKEIEKGQDVEDNDDDDDEDLGVEDFADEVSRPPSVRESHGGEEIVQLFEDQTVQKQGSRMEIKSGGAAQSAQTVTALSETAAEEQSAVRTIRLEDRDVQGVSYEPVGAISGLKYGFMGVDSVFDVAAISSLCNDAQLEFKEGQYGRIGEPTEAALKVLVEKLGVCGLVVDESPTRMARQCSDYWSGRFDKLAVLEFDRDRKSMSVLCRERGQQRGQGSREGDGNVLFVKGAAEVLITRCNRIKLESGSVVSITPEIRAQLNSKLQQMARMPLRNLALAYRLVQYCVLR
jgi:Cation transport ATPase (P-type)